MAGSSHGHNPAAWTGVTISFIGFCISGAFTVLANPLGFWAGIVVILLGGVVGLAMKAAGLGAPKESEEARRAREEAGRAQPLSQIQTH
ncbi:HGxxPAAW family protein [Streptomyces sp. Wb2n-11]|uniref:HGxxPAAW family protein n=1 Tax=Streptomyces sp. Wb2n-11 TaxID=1030533 RepID=UPI000A46B318|nr:HGxxPAAW family protein [Streptomyces sp. Wb2n-11]